MPTQVFNQLQISTAAAVPPLTVNQTALVTNFNADLLDGQHGAYYATAASLSGYLPLTGGTLTGTLTGTVGIFTTLRATELTSLLATNGPITITPDGTGHVHINSTDIRLGKNNTNATLATCGTGDLILRTHEGSAVEGSIRIYDGADGNIEITPNGTGTVVVGKLSGSTGSFSGQITSTLASGTAPLVVTSNTVVANLNSDFLDGQHGSFYQNAGNLNVGTLQAARLPAFSGGDVTSTVGTVGLNLTAVGTAGTYRSVTTDSKGRVTGGTNPTTLAGYGITDALPLTGGTLSGLLTAGAGITMTGGRLYVSSDASGQTYGGTIHIRDDQATGANNSFAGIAFSSAPGADFVIGKYSNAGVARLQIRNHQATTLVTIEVDGSASFAGGLTATNFTGPGTGLTGTAAGLSIGGSAVQLNGQAASFYQNAGNLNVGTLLAARMPAFTGGDVTSTAGTVALTLANSGVTAGTYTKVTVDAKGRVTTGALLASADLPTYTGTITSGQVTTALGFTPYNATNPSGYITSTASITGYSGGISVSDSRAVVTTPQSINMGVVFDFKQNTTDGLSDGGTYFGEMTFRQYGSGTDWSGGSSHQLGFTDNGNIWQRSGSNTTWGAWKKLLDTSNFSSHALPLSGGTLTGQLFSNSKIETAGTVTGSIFYGAGTGLTGTAPSLTAGAVPWTGVTGKPTTLAGYGITDALPLTGGTLSGTLSITNTGPVIILRDSDSAAGASQIGYISLQDSAGTERGWIGFGSSVNTDLTMYNGRGDVVLSSSTGIARVGSNAIIHAATTSAPNLSVGGSAGSVAWTGVTGKPTTLSGYGITDALNTSGTAQTKSGNLTVNSALTSGGAFYAATTVQYSNRQPIYTIYYGGGQDLAWKKVADITIGTGLYRGVTFKVDVVDNQGNFGWNSNCLTLTYFASCIRSGGVQDVPNDAVVTGPVADYVRVVKTATGVYELQIRQLADWQTYVFTVEATINSGGNTVTYASSAPPNGSTTGTIYTATPGWTSRLANIAVAGSGSFAGQITSTVATGTAPLVITSTTAVANLNSDLLDGQHGSYFEGRDTTAVGFSGGTLTLTRAAGNLTANLDGRYLPLAGGTMSGDLTATRIRGVNSLVLNTFTTVNPASNVFLYSQPNDRDAWLFLDSADTGSNWGIYHRQIDSAVSGLPANSIGFIGGGSSALQAWISLANGSANFQGALTQAGNQVLHAGNYTSYALPIGGGTLTGGLSGTTGSFSGQITSTVATGTAPFVVASTTRVNNLNVQYLDGQIGAYYAAASSLASYLPKSGGAMTGALALHSTGTNGFYNGTGDAATYALYNFKLGGWNGMALENLSTGGTYPSQVVGVINFREGTIDMKGGFKVNGASVITENQSITISGDASGTGKTAITLTLASVGTAGTYRSVTTDAKGRVTAGTNPTTLAGYGITDALPITGGALTGTISIDTSGSTSLVSSVIIKRSGQSSVNFGQYAGAWRSALQIQSNSSDRLLFLAPPEADYQFGILRSANGGLKIDVGGTTSNQGTNAVTIDTTGTANFPVGLQQNGSAVLTAATTSAPNLSIGGSAARWATGRTISLTGDVSGTSAAFDGTAALSFATTLANSGVGAGTYRSVTVNAKGLVTAGTNPTTISGYGITDAMYQVDPNGFTQGDINGSGNMQRLWGTDSVQNLIAFRPPTTVEYTTDNVNWVATTISNDVFDGKVFGKWAGFNMNVGSNIGAWTKVRMTWVNFGYHFFSHFTLCHSTNGHSMNFVFYKSDLSGVFSSEAYRVNGISSWPGYTFTSHVNVSGWWDTRDVRMVFELNGNNGPSGYPNNAISIGHIGIMGGYSSFNRVFDWDGNRNITLFGNLTLPGNVSATGTVSGSSFSGAGTNLTGTANSLNVGGYSARWATGRTIALTGDVTGTSGAFDGTAALSFGVTIANSAVTYAKIQNVATTSVLGNSSASAAQAPAALSMATLAGMLSNQAMNINGSATSVPWSGVTGKPTTVTGYGITDAMKIFGAPGVDLNTLTVSGVYRIQNVEANRPNDYGQLLVMYGGSDTITQIYGDYASGTLKTRSGNPTNVGGSGVYTPWRTLLADNNFSSYALPLTGGTLTGTLIAPTLQLANGFQIQQGASSYGQFSNWVHLNGSYGFYSGVNNAHIYPNNASYGAWRIQGTRGGWGGIEFENNNVSLMMGSDTVGFHQNANGWLFRVHQGVGYIYKGSWGGSTAATILDSSNYNSYAFGLSTNNAVSGSNTYTNTNLFKSAVGSTVYLGSANTPPLQAYSSDGGPAFMSFHRGGSYAVNMGLDPDNVLRIGGWSAAANRWQLDMSGNNTIPGTMTAASFSGAGTGLTGTASSLTAGSSTSCSGSAAQLNGQAASYYENRDTTAVGISAGTLTLTRAAGNLTTTIGGRIVAWCEFNGNFASTQSPNAGFNVSSITKNASGDYTVNFTSALANTNYVVSGYAQLDTTNNTSNYNLYIGVPRRSGAKATGSCRIACEYPGNSTLYDSVSVGVAFIAA